MELLIGCSGYSYQDWKGAFYPPNIRKKELIRYYEKHFPVVEINATYYAFIGEKVFESMVEKTSKLQFSVKLHKIFTHERSYTQRDRDTFLASLKPLVEEGRLKSLLAQFPNSFHFNRKNLDDLKKLRDDFQTIPMAIEFRNQNWMRLEVFEAISKLGNVALVNVDGPSLPGLFLGPWMSVGQFDYIRLHGRNKQKWYNHREPWERYDYEYTREELEELAHRIKNLKNSLKLVFFNNHYKAKGPRNARELIKIMGVEYGNNGGMQRLFV